MRRTRSAEEITTTCSYDCGGRCLLKVRVDNGRVAGIGTGNRLGLHTKACPRGLAQRSVLYAEKRLTRPLRRVGPRGEGSFEPVSWDAALDRIASEIHGIREGGETESIYFVPGSGSLSTLHNTYRPVGRFFGMLGRCSTTRGDASFEGALQSSLATFGTPMTGCSRDNLVHSRLIVLWGWNPLVTRFGPETVPYLLEARRSGTEIVCVDPRFTRTARKLADRWIPIRPGTDTAMLLAMAYVTAKEKLMDEPFVDKFTLGFKAFEEYLFGRADGKEKTPQWAAEICGVEAEEIVRLARGYALRKPAALMTGWAPGRTLFGEQFHRAASALAAITGNIGIAGGHVAGGLDFVAAPNVKGRVPAPGRTHHEVHITELYNALLSGGSHGDPLPCELLYIVGCNLLNQHLNVNKGRRALMKPRVIVAHDLFLTPTARYADFVLPVSHFLERDDIGQPYLGGPYSIFMNKVVEPGPGQKSDLEIFSLLADRLGMEGYNNLSDEQWLESFLAAEAGFPDLELFRAQGVHLTETSRPHVAFHEQMSRPDTHPFPTPSGKIEIFSSRFAELRDPKVPPIPTYLSEQDGPSGAPDKRYPLLLISTHSRARVNSQFDNIRALKKMADDRVWIHSSDAKGRGIQEGDMVVVYNDLGRILTPARVTDGIVPGAVSLDQGQWTMPDDQNTDVGGCVNVLIPDRMSPTGAFPSNSCRVQIEKA